MLNPGSSTLLPDVLLLGYRNGFFPMADPDLGRILWHRPEQRGVIPLDRVKISRSLRKEIERNTFTITTDQAFRDVITACADREDTWISDEIVDAYTQLHELGHAHSVEAWYDDTLVGGLYGVSIGGAFFGESMFSRKSNASKVAFAHLVYRLNSHGYRLTRHPVCERLHCLPWGDRDSDVVYQMLLADALHAPCSFT